MLPRPQLSSPCVTSRGHRRRLERLHPMVERFGRRVIVSGFRPHWHSPKRRSGSAEETVVRRVRPHIIDIPVAEGVKPTQLRAVTVTAFEVTLRWGLVATNVCRCDTAMGMYPLDGRRVRLLPARVQRARKGVGMAT